MACCPCHHLRTLLWMVSDLTWSITRSFGIAGYSNLFPDYFKNLLALYGFKLIWLLCKCSFIISQCFHNMFLFLFLFDNILNFLPKFSLGSYVSETERRHAFPSQAQQHILAGLASTVGGLSAPYEKASRVHERPVVDWLWATGCHPFGPFSNTSKISQMLQDVAVVSNFISLKFCQSI